MSKYDQAGMNELEKISRKNLELTSNFALNEKIKESIKGSIPSIYRYYLRFKSDKDKELVADFLILQTKQEGLRWKAHFYLG